jgi:hypothetical protein
MTRERTITISPVRRVAVASILSVLAAAALLPGVAEARPVDSEVIATVVGTIDSRAGIRYFFSGEVDAENLTYTCMEGRQVVLFKVGPDGGRRKVGSARTELFGEFIGAVEQPLATMAGRYFVKVKPRVRKTRRGPLRCLAARSATFLVEVPGELTD